MSSRIVLIGLDRHLLGACARRGLDPIVICTHATRDFGLPEAPTDTYLVDGPLSLEQTLSAICDIQSRGISISAVLTNTEENVVLAATLNQLLGLRGPDPAFVVGYRDKYLQKQRVSAAGIPTAKIATIRDVTEDDRPDSVPPLIVKPRYGAGTQLTKLISTDKEYYQFQSSWRPGSPRSFVAESLAHGDEYILDGIVQNGEIVFASVSKYLVAPLDAVTSDKPYCIVSVEDSTAAAQRIHSLGDAAIIALGAPEGIFHLEAFDDGSRAQFSECALRRGGAMQQELVLAKHGVNLADAALTIALGDRVCIEPQRSNMFISSTTIPNTEGTILRLPSTQDIIRQPGIIEAVIELPVGTQTHAQRASTTERTGQILAAGRTEEQSISFLLAAQQYALDQVVAAPSGPLRALRDAEKHRKL